MKVSEKVYANKETKKNDNSQIDITSTIRKSCQ